MAAFLANVGVNAGHAARSPLFDDGTFELVPIPERVAWRPPMVRLGDLTNLASHAPRTWAHKTVHLDPDFASTIPTYGDNCRHAGRAFSLRSAARGDVIVFIARLHARDGQASFYLVGSLEIEDVLRDATADPGAGWWDRNAHVLRARAHQRWDSFWVFKGGPNSRPLHRAVAFGHEEAESVFGEWRWPQHRTELQTIGSHTRAVRRLEGVGEEWLRAACRS